MKKILFTLLFPLLSFGQANIIEQSNGNTQTNNKGGLGLAKVFLLPLGNHDALFEFTRYKSRMQYNESGNFIEYHNGTSWNRMIDLSYANLNYKPFSYIPTWEEITGKPNIVNYSAGSGISISAGVITNTSPDQTISITAGNGITITGTYPNFTIALKQPTLNNVSRSIVTTAAAANGFQVSSTAFSNVNYSVTINTSVSLSGNSSGYVVLETCSTNSATAGDWIERARTTSGQSGTLVIGLVLNQAGGGSSSVPVAAGHYVRLRSVNVSGTPTYTFNSGIEAIYN